MIREKKMLKLIRKALKEDHMYTQDEIIYMKKEINNLEDTIQQLRKFTKKGFGD